MKQFTEKDWIEIDKIIDDALKEDIGSGDITTEAVFESYMIEFGKLFFVRVSVNERIKPIKPVNRPVIINPTRVNTKIFSSGALKRVENKKIAVNSRVPKPAKVIGIKPAALAIGNKNKK